MMKLGWIPYAQDAKQIVQFCLIFWCYFKNIIEKNILTALNTEFLLKRLFQRSYHCLA